MKETKKLYRGIEEHPAVSFVMDDLIGSNFRVHRYAG